MEERYSRNRLYMSEKEQSVIKDYKIFLDNALFSFAHVEPVSAVSFFHNEIIILGKCRRNKAYMHYTKV